MTQKTRIDAAIAAAKVAAEKLENETIDTAALLEAAQFEQASDQPDTNAVEQTHPPEPEPEQEQEPNATQAVESVNTTDQPLPDGKSLPIAVVSLTDLYALSATVALADKVKNKKNPAGAYLMVMVPEAEPVGTTGQKTLPTPQVYMTANDGQHMHIITPDVQTADDLTTTETKQNAQHLVAACGRGEAPLSVVKHTNEAGVQWHRLNLFMLANTVKALMSQVKPTDLKNMAKEQVKGQRVEKATIVYTHSEQAKKQAELPAAERRGGTGMFSLLLADGTIYPLVDAEHFGAKPDGVHDFCRSVVNETQKACAEYQPFADLTDEKNLVQGRTSPLEAYTSPATMSNAVMDIHKHLQRFDKDAVMMQLATAHKVCDVNLWGSDVSTLQRSIVAMARYLPHIINKVTGRAWSLPGQ